MKQNRTRTALADAYMRLLNDYTIDRITVKMITDTVGCSRKTFYYYFTDIYVLTQYVFELRVQHFLDTNGNFETVREGFLTLAAHMHKNFPVGHPGYMGRLSYAQDVYAVTAACLMVRKDVYEQVDGLDESFAVAFNDVDFCLRVRDKGYRIVWTPYAQLTHYESKSRGGDEKDPVKAARFAAEQQRLYDIHGKADILDDPYYNPSLTHDREDFSESGDLRNLKEGKVTVRWRNA